MNQLGYYGKTPHRGDFVRFNLPQIFITAWDDWLQQLMAFGKEQHPDWSDQFSQAPVVRFMLSSGMAGNCAWAGLMKPSCDKVGRQFPFTLAMSLPPGTCPVKDMQSLDAWFDQAQLVMDQAFSAQYDFNQLQEALGEFRSSMPVEPPDVSAEQQVHCPELLSLSLHDTAANLSQPAALATLLDSVLAQTISEYSLWTRSDTHHSRLLLNAGLPVAHAALALFNDQWQNTQTLTVSPTLPQPVPEQTVDSQERVDTAVPPQAQARQSDEANKPPALRSDTTSPSSDPQQPEAVVNRAPEQTDSGDATRSAEAKHPPSPDDWAVLEEFQPATKEDAIALPTVEPLELDDDDLPDAPWEK